MDSPTHNVMRSYPSLARERRSRRRAKEKRRVLPPSKACRFGVEVAGHENKDLQVAKEKRGSNSCGS